LKLITLVWAFICALLAVVFDGLKVIHAEQTGAFTISAWAEDRALVTTIAPLTAIDGDAEVAAGDDIVVPKFRHLIGAYAGHGVTAVAGSGSQAYLDAPSLRRVTRNEIPAIDDFATFPLPGVVQLFPTSPLVLDEGESLNAYLANTAVAAAGIGMIAALLADGPVAPVKGEIRTILLTSVVVGTLVTWSSGPLTLAYDLPAGRYQVVGARCIAGATSQVFRLIFPEQWNRPGGVSARTIVDPDIPLQRAGNLGVWGEFTHRVLPRLEVLNVETVANPSIYLDILKVG